MPENDEHDWDEWLASLTSTTRAAITSLHVAKQESQPKAVSRAIPDGAYLTLREVARKLRVSQGKVLEWIKRGRIKAMDVGRAGRPSYRIDIAALAKSLESVTQPPKVRRSPRKLPGFVERY